MNKVNTHTNFEEGSKVGVGVNTVEETKISGAVQEIVEEAKENIEILDDRTNEEKEQNDEDLYNIDKFSL